MVSKYFIIPVKLVLGHFLYTFGDFFGQTGCDLTFLTFASGIDTAHQVMTRA